jgi:hypothetical protein
LPLRFFLVVFFSIFSIFFFYSLAFWPEKFICSIKRGDQNTNYAFVALPWMKKKNFMFLCFFLLHVCLACYWARRATNKNISMLACIWIIEFFTTLNPFQVCLFLLCSLYLLIHDEVEMKLYTQIRYEFEKYCAKI